jgi:hypothetical protein
MSTWTRSPTLYEINTWVWLCDLTLEYGKDVDLSSVPSAEGMLSPNMASMLCV